MDSEFSSLKERMAQGGDWKTFRDEIVRLHSRASSESEYVTLMEAWQNLVSVGRYAYDEETYAKLLPITRAEYLNFLNRESMHNDIIDPVRLEHVTRREVDAGRLDENDELRKLAIAGARILGSSSTSTGHQCRNGSWFFYGAVGAAVFAAGLGEARLSPYWAIGLCLIVGWFINEYEKRHSRPA